MAMGLVHRNVHGLCNSNTWNLDQRDGAEPMKH